MDFFKKYRIKGETESFESFEEFQNLRIGVVIQKNTGEEFVKTADECLTSANTTCWMLTKLRPVMQN